MTTAEINDINIDQENNPKILNDILKFWEEKIHEREIKLMKKEESSINIIEKKPITDIIILKKKIKQLANKAIELQVDLSSNNPSVSKEDIEKIIDSETMKNWDKRLNKNK